MFLAKKPAAVLCALLLLVTSSEIVYAKTPAPTQAQIDAAKAAEVAKQKAASSAQSKLTSATQTLKQLSAIADAAAAKIKSGEVVVGTKVQ